MTYQSLSHESLVDASWCNVHVLESMAVLMDGDKASIRKVGLPTCCRRRADGDELSHVYMYTLTYYCLIVFMAFFGEAPIRAIRAYTAPTNEDIFSTQLRSTTRR